MQPRLSVAAQILQELNRWAPWIWAGTSGFGLLVSARLWELMRNTRKQVADVSEAGEAIRQRLLYFERFAVVAAILFVALIAVGVLAGVTTPNEYVGLFVLSILLITPTVITWLVYRAIRLRVT